MHARVRAVGRAQGYWPGARADGPGLCVLCGRVCASLSLPLSRRAARTCPAPPSSSGRRRRGSSRGRRQSRARRCTAASRGTACPRPTCPRRRWRSRRRAAGAAACVVDNKAVLASARPAVRRHQQRQIQGLGSPRLRLIPRPITAARGPGWPGRCEPRFQHARAASSSRWPGRRRATPHRC